MLNLLLRRLLTAMLHKLDAETCAKFLGVNGMRRALTVVLPKVDAALLSKAISGQRCGSCRSIASAAQQRSAANYDVGALLRPTAIVQGVLMSCSVMIRNLIHLRHLPVGVSRLLCLGAGEDEAGLGLEFQERRSATLEQEPELTIKDQCAFLLPSDSMLLAFVGKRTCPEHGHLTSYALRFNMVKCTRLAASRLS